MTKRWMIGGAISLLAAAILFFVFWTMPREPQLVAPEQQKITIYGEQMPTETNVMFATDPSSQTVLAHLYEGLYRYGSDGKLEQGLVDTLEVSEDQRVYTFTLRPSQTSRGEAVTASTFVTHFRALVDDETGSPFGFLLEQVKNAKKISLGEKDPEELGVRAIDDTTLEITLERPLEGFEEVLAMPALLPQEKAGFWDELDGNGPFAISAFNERKIIFSKNESYHQADDVFLTQWAMATKTKGDASGIERLATDVSDDTISRLEEKNELRLVGRSGVFYLRMKTDKGPLRSEPLRQALATVIDRQEIAPLLAPGERTTERLIVLDQEENDIVLTQDTDKLLAEAKKELKTKQIELEFLNFDDPEAREIGAALIRQIEQTLPGVQVKPIELELKEKVTRETKGSYAMSLSGWQPDYPGFRAYLNQFKSNNYLNSGKFKDKEFDELMKRAEETSSRKERETLYREAEKRLLEVGGAIPIYQTAQAYELPPQYRNIGFPMIGPSYVLTFAQVYEQEK